MRASLSLMGILLHVAVTSSAKCTIGACLASMNVSLVTEAAEKLALDAEIVNYCGHTGVASLCAVFVSVGTESIAARIGGGCTDDNAVLYEANATAKMQKGLSNLFRYYEVEETLCSLSDITVDVADWCFLLAMDGASGCSGVRKSLDDDLLQGFFSWMPVLALALFFLASAGSVADNWLNKHTAFHLNTALGRLLRNKCAGIGGIFNLHEEQ